MLQFLKNCIIIEIFPFVLDCLHSKCKYVKLQQFIIALLSLS